MRGQTQPRPHPSTRGRGLFVNRVQYNADWTEISQTLSRLMDEGFDRHGAINAIGNVLMGTIIDVVVEDWGRVDIKAKYGGELATITAASWRSRQELWPEVGDGLNG
jgi:hypothetical protein